MAGAGEDGDMMEGLIVYLVVVCSAILGAVLGKTITR